MSFEEIQFPTDISYGATGGRFLFGCSHAVFINIAKAVSISAFTRSKEQAKSVSRWFVNQHLKLTHYLRPKLTRL